MLSLVTMEAVRIGIAIRLLTVASIAIRRDAIRMRWLSFLLCWGFVFSFPFILTAIGFCMRRRDVSRLRGIVVLRRFGMFSVRLRFTHAATIIRLW